MVIIASGNFTEDCFYLTVTATLINLIPYPIFIINFHYGGQNYEMLLIVMVNINISFGTIDRFHVTSHHFRSPYWWTNFPGKFQNGVPSSRE